MREKNKKEKFVPKQTRERLSLHGHNPEWGPRDGSLFSHII